MVWICAGEVTVGEEPRGVVAADELEFFPVTHDDVAWVADVTGGGWGR